MTTHRFTSKQIKGFTLIEIIVSVALIGVLALLFAVGFIQGIQGYLLTKENNALSQKGQNALLRLSYEFSNILSVNSINANSISYKTLSSQRSIALINNAIKIIDGSSLPTAITGDILLDGVSTFTLSPKKGSLPWIFGTDSPQLLSLITISITLNRPDSDSPPLVLTTSIHPRNNSNYGGAAPTSNPPIKSARCFVASTVFQTSNHPVVIVLQEFRDKILLSFSAGKWLVEKYYHYGKILAEIIQPYSILKFSFRVILYFISGYIFCFLYFPKITIVAMILLYFCIYFFRPKHFLANNTQTQKGSILISLIIIMTVVGILGTAMLSFTTISQFTQIGTLSAMRARHLSESGFRFASHEFIEAAQENKNSVLQNINNKKYTLLNDQGSFTLKTYPYFYEVLIDPKTSETQNILQTKIYGSLESNILLSTGIIRVQGKYYPYSNVSVSGNQVNFTKESGTWKNINPGTSVYPVLVLAAQTLNSGGNLLFVNAGSGLSTGENAWPLYNGQFKLGSKTLTYKSLDTANNLLKEVYDPESNVVFPITISTNTKITLEKFVTLTSEGRAGEGSLQDIISTTNYHIPIGYFDNGSGDGKWDERFDDLDSWEVSSYGSHAINIVDSSNAVISTQQSLANNIKYSLKLLTEAENGVPDFSVAWNEYNHYLSYDIQIKCYIPNNTYMAGITFKLNDNNEHFGISFFRSNTGSSGGNDNDGITDAFTPKDMNLLSSILLWQNTSAGIKWLAYKDLTNMDNNGYVLNAGNITIKHWSTILVRMIEQPAGGGNKDNLMMVYIADTQVHGTPNTNAKDNNRLAVPRRDDTGGFIYWPPDDPSDTNSSNDYYTLIDWDKANKNVKITNGAIIEMNSILTPTSGDTITASVGFHSYGIQALNVAFDDFAINVLGGGIFVGFAPPLQD